jgi:hypothetical protein
MFRILTDEYMSVNAFIIFDGENLGISGMGLYGGGTGTSPTN